MGTTACVGPSSIFQSRCTDVAHNDGGQSAPNFRISDYCVRQAIEYFSIAVYTERLQRWWALRTKFTHAKYLGPCKATRVVLLGADDNAFDLKFARVPNSILGLQLW